MTIESIYPKIELEMIIESTGFELIVSNNLKETEPVAIQELKLLRRKLDPLEIIKLEVLSGKEREDLLDEIIKKELAKQNKFLKLLSI